MNLILLIYFLSKQHELILVNLILEDKYGDLSSKIIKNLRIFIELKANLKYITSGFFNPSSKYTSSIGSKSDSNFIIN